MTPEERQAILDIRRQAISALVLSNRLLGLPDGDTDSYIDTER